MIVEVIGKILFILLVVMGAFLPMITWVERKQSAVMQDRVGANNLRNHAAPVDVTGQNHRHPGRVGKPHVGNICGA